MDYSDHRIVIAKVCYILANYIWNYRITCWREHDVNINRAKGARIGRPRVTRRRGFEQRLMQALQQLDTGDISRRRAARDLGIGYATLKRLGRPIIK